MEERESSYELRELENQADALNDAVRHFQREEENEDEQILKELRKIDRMFDICGEGDIKLKSLLEEKQNRLHKMRKEKNEFADELFAKAKDEQRKLEVRREELICKMNESQEEKSKES